MNAMIQGMPSIDIHNEPPRISSFQGIKHPTVVYKTRDSSSNAKPYQTLKSPQTKHPWDLFGSFIHKRIEPFSQTISNNNISDTNLKNHVKPTPNFDLLKLKTTTVYCFTKPTF